MDVNNSTAKVLRLPLVRHVGHSRPIMSCGCGNLLMFTSVPWNEEGRLTFS